MNAERLLAHYHEIADAPDAIARLRRFILDLAVRGKLVAQNASDEPASELLKRIAKEKARLVKAGAIRTDKPLPRISQDEQPFDLPFGWVLTRLGDLIHLVSGQHLQPTEYSEDPNVGLPYITGPSDFAAEGLHITRFALVRKAVAKKGQLLLTVKGSGVGKTTTCDIPEVAISRQLMALTAIAWDDRFLVLITHRLAKKLQGEARSLIPGISREDVERFVFPLPPLVEQHRIVAKVDELMGLCDRLEAARTAREAARDRLAAASLARLNAPDPDTFEADARFSLDVLPALSTRPDQIKQLRQTILNLAVRGRLVPQDPNDEAAPRFDRSIPGEIELPFSIPTVWSWSRLSALGKLKGGGTPSKARDDFWNGTIPWVSPKDMKVDYLTEAQMSITKSAIAGSAVSLIEPESVLFVVRGMILAHSFPVAISRVPLTINQDMKALALNQPTMAEYLLRALKGLKPEMLARVQRSSHGTCRLEGSDYSGFLIPIPPLAEQHRIVAKVDTLMALCDRLEASLAATAVTRRRLLDALLAEALAPTDDRELEAAE
jgi:type I restriction enzyme S subunit